MLKVINVDEKENSLEITTPEIEVVYPDLTISDIVWQPKEIKYGRNVNFRIKISLLLSLTVFLGVYAFGAQNLSPIYQLLLFDEPENEDDDGDGFTENQG